METESTQQEISYNLNYKFVLVLLATLLLSSFWTPVFAKKPILTEKDLATSPPRIIRACCSFGVDLKFVLIPLVKRTDIISEDDLGQHSYLGGSNEGNGIIYTKRGGFIDIGHLRDCADWTAYLYSLIEQNSGSGNEVLKELKTEGGAKTLTFKIPSGFDSLKTYQLAGKIAYDLSLWHEIATWFGASYIPLVPERYSSFSPEDLYSNLLGVKLGIKALKSKLEYNDAMTLLIANMLDSLESVTSIDDTYLAMEKVEDIWWTKEKRLPNKKILIERNTCSESYLLPWLVVDDENESTPYRLTIPDNSLCDLYVLSIKLNYKFPLRTICPSHKNRIITQKDFGVIMNYVRHDIADLQSKMARREMRQQIRRDKRHEKVNT